MLDKEDNIMGYVFLYPNRSYVDMDPPTCEACFYLMLAKTSSPSRDITCAPKNP